MSTDDDVSRANDQGLNADAATQTNLWTSDGDRHDDGYRRDEFGNRMDDDGNRVDPDGRPIDAGGDVVNHDGQRVDDGGRPLNEGDDDLISGVIPPMMGR